MFERCNIKKAREILIFYQFSLWKIGQLVTFKRFFEKCCFSMKYAVKRKKIDLLLALECITCITWSKGHNFMVGYILFMLELSSFERKLSNEINCCICCLGFLETKDATAVSCEVLDLWTRFLCDIHITMCIAWIFMGCVITGKML